MTEQKDTSNKRVFFIASNQSKLDKDIKYSINDGKKDLSSILKKTIKFKGEDFTYIVYYFYITPEDLIDKNKVQNSKKYKAKIQLKLKKCIFPGEILFLKERNNFIYDYELKECRDWTSITYPPPRIQFTNADKIKIFNDVLKQLNVKQGDELSLNLISDSQLLIMGQLFCLDFYLEIYKLCYTKREGRLHLAMFKLNRVLIPEKFNTKLYSGFLKLIETKPNKITEGVDNPDKYLKSFYSLLLYFRANLEKDKVQSLLINKNLWKYFVDILPINYKSFSNLDISDELINEMLKKQKIKFEEIKGILCFAGNTDRFLSIINNNIDIITECCKKEKKEIKMSEMVNPNKNDDLIKIIEEIKKIIQYQVEKNTNFILFDEDFWKNYIHFNDKVNIKNLLLIKKAVIIYIEANNTINYEQLALKFAIHNTGILSIERGELKNYRK